MAGVMRNEGSKLAYVSFPQLHRIITDKDFDDMVIITNESYHGLKFQSIRQFYLKDDHKNHSSDVLRKAFYEFYGDIHIKCPTYLTAKQYANYAIKSGSKNRVYFYELTYESKFAKFMGCDEHMMGVCHGSELDKLDDQWTHILDNNLINVKDLNPMNTSRLTNYQNLPNQSNLTK
ncbi:unnamed protein product [Oppiella nova]|uniref:Carboxylesterase type B domain-containing protein n=1 Tax=Oppiella nova TaxID=334625 RepID=A0A7R9ML09_9ACAR|nr:unnamed protein product [Oppiella nova]CAG2179344.1 unnamed protein product [Oppiella nova]